MAALRSLPQYAHAEGLWSEKPAGTCGPLAGNSQTYYSHNFSVPEHGRLSKSIELNWLDPSSIWVPNGLHQRCGGHQMPHARDLCWVWDSEGQLLSSRVYCILHVFPRELPIGELTKSRKHIIHLFFYLVQFYTGLVNHTNDWGRESVIEKKKKTVSKYTVFGFQSSQPFLAIFLCQNCCVGSLRIKRRFTIDTE